jgi:hypothetical protein
MFKTRDVVNLILAAIPEIRAERTRLDRRHGIDQTDNIDLTELPVEDTRSTRLRAELMSFDEESLLRAEAAMYYGRDCDVAFHEKLACLRRLGEPKELIVGTLLEKLPACARYFAQAMTDLQNEGLALEAV